MPQMSKDFLGRMLEWLRQGYPDELPSGDYVALLGVLRRRLTDSEIEEIVDDLATGDNTVQADEIRKLMREYSLQEPSKRDVGRVVDALEDEGVKVVKKPKQESEEK